MRVSIKAAFVGAFVSIGAVADWSLAQDQGEVRVATSAPAATPAAKFKFILFWKENNAATQGMTDVLNRSVAQRSQRAEWVAVNVNDPAQRPVVDRYHVARAPMPMVLCVAPNGAITGGMSRQISDKAIEDALVTPRMTESAKAIQDKKIVIIHVKRDAQQPLPAGAAQFMSDPDFKARTASVSVLLDDPAEARFIREMEINPAEIADSQLVVIAPPGVFVGKFASVTTAGQIAAQLHAAGKCCNDPNCKHNKKGQ